MWFTKSQHSNYRQFIGLNVHKMHYNATVFNGPDVLDHSNKEVVSLCHLKRTHTEKALNYIASFT